MIKQVLCVLYTHTQTHIYTLQCVFGNFSIKMADQSSFGTTIIVSDLKCLFHVYTAKLILHVVTLVVCKFPQEKYKYRLPANHNSFHTHFTYECLSVQSYYLMHKEYIITLFCFFSRRCYIIAWKDCFVGLLIFIVSLDECAASMHTLYSDAPHYSL